MTCHPSVFNRHTPEKSKCLSSSDSEMLASKRGRARSGSCVSTTDVVYTHTFVLHTACQRPTSFLRTLQSCTQRVNDRRRFYAHFEDLALVLVVFCDMVWILTDFDVSAAILVDVR